MIEGADYFIRIADFPVGIHGFVVPNDDGTFSVYINARDSHVRQRQACRHEKKHIDRNDFTLDDVLDAEKI